MVLNDPIFLLVRSDITIPFSLILVLRASANTLELSADVAWVGVEYEIGNTSGLLEALSTAAISVWVLLSLVFTDYCFVLDFVSKLHHGLFNAHGANVHREFIHRITNLVEAFKLVHSGQWLDLEVLLATLVNHLFLLLSFDGQVAILIVLCNEWRWCFSSSPILLILNNFTCLKLHFIEFLSLLLSSFLCFFRSDLIKSQSLLVLIWWLACFWIDPSIQSWFVGLF